MELKVWVEGIQRIVCGVSETTTCQDVVYALAHATGKTGRFTLIERWRNSERLLAPHEHPLKILLKWGEHASDVQLILQRSALEPKMEKNVNNHPVNSRGAQRVSQTAIVDSTPPTRALLNSPSQSTEIKKSLTFSGAHSANQLDHPETVKRDQVIMTPPHESSPGNNHMVPSSCSTLINRSPLKPNNAEVRIKNDSRGDINENLIMNNVQINVEQPLKCSPKEGSAVKDIIKQLSQKDENCLDQRTEEVIVDSYYKDLVSLVNQQREKLSSQQIDLTKFEAEIAFTEGKWKEEESRLAYIQNEIHQLENLPDEKSESSLQNVPLEQLEDQFKEAKQSESKSQDDIISIKTKLEDIDHQLAQMNHRIRLLHEAIQEGQRKQQKETFKEEEQDAILREIEKLQMAVLQASKQAEHAQTLSQQLTQEMTEAECLLNEKRKEIEGLRQAMKDANMEALAMTPPDDAKALSENRIGNGTSRRMKGSPRQLETAVPTSKNPHGVWV